MKMLMMWVLVAALVFLLSMVGLLGATGNLNKDALGRILGRTVEPGPELVQSSDALGQLADQLKKERAVVLERERIVKTREEQVDVRLQEVTEKLEELKRQQQAITGNLEAAEQDRNLAIQTVAISMSAMKADAAAKLLADRNPKEAAAILLAIDDEKKRGKILDELEASVGNDIVGEMIKLRPQR
jgi:flagellar motility protein MotE (MotC chaperone)